MHPLLHRPLHRARPLLACEEAPHSLHHSLYTRLESLSPHLARDDVRDEGCVPLPVALRACRGHGTDVSRTSRDKSCVPPPAAASAERLGEPPEGAPEVDTPFLEISPYLPISPQKAHLRWTRTAHLADTSQTWRGGERRQHGTSSSRDGPLSASLGPSPHTSRGGVRVRVRVRVRVSTPLWVVRCLEQPAREDEVHLRSRQLTG